MKDCNKCGTKLNYDNCYSSDLSRGGYICKNCRKINYNKNITSEKQRRYSKVKNIKLKEDIIKAYGEKCYCCGESGWPFLSIDHVDNTGAKHRKKLGISAGLPTYQWLKNNNYPKDGFRVLCMNCNCSIGFHGFCAHDLISSNLKVCVDCGDALNSPGRFSNRFQLYDKYNLPLCKSCTIIRKSGKCLITQSMRDDKAKSLNLRLKLITGYGGKCCCCGEDHPLFLTIDHINNNGAVERKAFKNNLYKFYRFLINSKYPSDNYRLLCYNCNCARGSYGFCFHNMSNEYKDISVYREIIKNGS